MPGGIHAPIDVVLSWPAANTINPETRPNTFLVVACIFGPITIIMLFTRLWVRIFHQRNVGWDDWLMLAGTVPTIALSVLYPLAVRHTFNRHIWDIEPLSHPEQMVASRKYVLVVQCVFCLAAGFIKVSILLFYRRLSSRVVSNIFRWTTWLAIGFIAAYTIALTIAPLLGCETLSAFWDQVDSTKLFQGYTYKCFDEGADIFAASIISTFQDFITAVLPTFLFWNLRIPVRQKIALFGIFAIGYGVVALGVLRAYYSWQTYYNTYDVTWVSWKLFLVSLLELHVGCFCANAPTFKVFFNHFLGDRISSSIKKSRSSPKNSSNKSSTSSTDMVAVLFSKSNSRSTSDSTSFDKKGYISDMNPGVSVDMHGGVVVQKSFHVGRESGLPIRPGSHSTMRQSTDTADLFLGRYYDDIELGHMSTSHNSLISSVYPSRIAEDDEEVEAVPKIPASPRAMEASKSFRFHPLSPAKAVFPQPPNPAFTRGARNPEGIRRNSCPNP